MSAIVMLLLCQPKQVIGQCNKQNYKAHKIIPSAVSKGKVLKHKTRWNEIIITLHDGFINDSICVLYGKEMLIDTIISDPPGIRPLSYNVKVSFKRREKIFVCINEQLYFFKPKRKYRRYYFTNFADEFIVNAAETNWIY
jgi:hypothetical protein